MCMPGTSALPSSQLSLCFGSSSNSRSHPAGVVIFMVLALPVISATLCKNSASLFLSTLPMVLIIKSASIPTRHRYLNLSFSFMAISKGVEYNSHLLLNSTQASALHKAPASASTGSMGSAALPTPCAAGSQITIGFAPKAKALLAAAFTTLSSDSVSAVITTVSPGFTANISLMSMSDAFPSSYSYSLAIKRPSFTLFSLPLVYNKHPIQGAFYRPLSSYRVLSSSDSNASLACR